MEFEKTNLEGLLLIRPRVFEDNRGYFFESYHSALFSEAGINVSFVQDNQSMSDKGVLRGLHFQRDPYAQGKLVRVLQGSVLDVAVDIRKESPTYGRHYKQVLSGGNKLMLWIPAGFAHGFLTLEDKTVFFYKCTTFYNKSSEASIRWNDPVLDIEWGIKRPIVSEKDALAPLFNNY